MEGRASHWVIWSCTIGAAVAFALAYFGYLMPVDPAGLDPALFQRGISTPLLRVINGYGGAVLDMNHMGGVAIVLIPLSFWWLWHRRSAPRWLMAGLSGLWLCILLIGALGGFNYRYAFTLLPVITGAIFLSVPVALQHHGFSVRQQRSFLLALVCLAGIDVALAVRHRSMVEEKTCELVKTPASTSLIHLDSGPSALSYMLQDHGVGPNDTVLVNNLPSYFFLTRRPGRYYWCGSDELFLSQGPVPLLRSRSEDDAAAYLLDSLHCSFIFSTQELSRYDARFLDFLEQRCELLATDANGHTLHRVLSDPRTP